jgi:hypothetical protein
VQTCRKVVVARNCRARIWLVKDGGRAISEPARLTARENVSPGMSGQWPPSFLLLGATAFHAKYTAHHFVMRKD